MDKEQFDHIDIFFRQAAMNVSPPANEEAWRKMEVLLDREFQKKRRRGIIWWWTGILFFLILGGTTFYYNHSKTVKTAKGVIGTSPHLTPVDRTEGQDKKSGLQQQNHKQVIPATSDQNGLAQRQNQDEPVAAGKQSLPDANDPVTAGMGTSINMSKGPVNKPERNYIGVRNNPKARSRNTENKASNDRSKNEQFLDHTLHAKLPLSDLTGKPGFQSPAIPYINSSEGTSALNKSLPGVLTHASHTSIKLKQERRFYFIAAISPNASAIGKIQLDKFNSRIGLGAGYQLTKKISFQTGIYAGRMIYTAGEGDYTIKPGSYISKIIKINADCYFYNVPLSVRYNAWQRKKYNLYAVGGLSSFWSKNETYDYHFLNSNGAYRNMVSSYKNNKDLFSAANLSLGVERSLSKVLYLQAEPYLVVPVSGVGEGKVKLRSAGLQFGIKYKPLRK